jgi:hypothetical protein
MEPDPPGVARYKEPEAPEPTTIIRVVDERTWKEATGTPPSETSVVPVRWTPVTVIKVPAAALVGVNELMMGAGMNVNPLRTALPPLVTISSEPEDPFPTTASTVEEEMRL